MCGTAHDSSSDDNSSDQSEAGSLLTSHLVSVRLAWNLSRAGTKKVPGTIPSGNHWWKRKKTESSRVVLEQNGKAPKECVTEAGFIRARPLFFMAA